jgi:hypothetical protein
MSSKNNCIDLAKEFGDRFLVETDEGYVVYWGDPEPPPERHELRVMCRHGMIAPYGRNRLVASTSRKTAAKALAGLACTKVMVVGDDTEAVFNLVDFEAVAAIMRPHPNTRPTQKERALRFAKSLGRNLQLGLKRRNAAAKARRAKKLAGQSAC